MKITGIDHLVLRTTQTQIMVDFYCQVLSCVVERQLAPDVGLTQLRAGSALIDIVAVDSELGRLGGRASSGRDNNLDHFCLGFTEMSLSDLLVHLTKHNVRMGEVATRYGAQGFGQSVYIFDPDGNTVELKLEVS
ncbi:VOC family protein [Algibacillus agarilyticus]|uniref:VOC family protein n=1 Tax=Algibacillus agarilyticus TaxID=2234133 RepID=UPI000DD0D2AC|nr:VOC family protein [Algibacillus agarilyticus]